MNHDPRRLAFPPGFVWGAATSSYQIEGAVQEDGRGESIWDVFCRVPGKILEGSNGDVACDHYHRFREDIAILKQLGLQAYRFSIAWPRILPAGRGSVNEAGLDFYARLVDAVLEAGITPYATLYHWDLPQALEDEGGWPSRRVAEAFADYTDIVTRRLGDRVKHWITHNEPWCAAFVGYQRGSHAPGRESWPDALAASHHLLLSHGLAVRIVRANVPEAKVGITLNLGVFEAASPSLADREARRWEDGHLNRWFLDPLYGRGYPDDMIRSYVAAGHLPAAGPEFLRPGDLEIIAEDTDFLGVNFYFRNVCRSRAVPEEQNAPRTVFEAPASEWTEMGWEVHAPSFWSLLVRIHLDYAPTALVITENGASFGTGPDAQGRIRDERRVQYLRDHLVAAQRAIQDGVPVRGYFVWSLLDNFEWRFGYGQRFGIVWVDYATQARQLKDSAYFYRDVVAHDAVDPEAVLE